MKWPGWQVGRVQDITLDPETQLAEVSLKIYKDVELTDDVIASVRSRGLIGDKYVSISPGGSDVILGEGDLIVETQSSIFLRRNDSKICLLAKSKQEENQ